MLLTLALIGCGFAVGLVVGRWWALLGPIGFGIYLYWSGEHSRVAHSDIPWGLIAVIEASAAAVGVTVGILVRRLIRSRPSPK